MAFIVKHFVELFNHKFNIPAYQRGYRWEKKQIEDLLSDLVEFRLSSSGNKSFYCLQPVVVTTNRERSLQAGETVYDLIDGQQRLTTVSLLFLAMYNLIDKGVIAPATANLKQRIFEEYLVDKWKPEDTRIKLKPVKNDQTAFGKLFSDPTEHIRESNLTVNYDYFYDRIQKQEITIDQLYDAICCLEIINIRLDMDDNPQLIFESLNSTGLDLS